jgi:hypothetical protein
VIQQAGSEASAAESEDLIELSIGKHGASVRAEDVTGTELVAVALRCLVPVG